MSAIATNLQAVRQRIRDAAEAYGRDPASVRLLEMSKTWPAACWREAAKAGWQAFGKSHIRKAPLMAIPALADDFEAQCRPWRRIRELFDHLSTEGLSLEHALHGHVARQGNGDCGRSKSSPRRHRHFWNTILSPIDA